MQKKILILGAGEMQVPIIKRSKDLGYYTIVADYNKEAIGFDYADEKQYISTNDYNSLLRFSICNNIDGILTTSDMPVNVVAKISEQLGLFSMSTKVAEICTNKYLQRKLFQKNKINVPWFNLCTSERDLEKCDDFPLIVKPIDSSASRGVKMVNSYEELLIAYKEALKFSPSCKVIVEQYIGGKEYSVETLTQNYQTSIIAITEKLVRGENYFVEDTHIQYARISSEEDDIIKTIVLEAINTLGVNNSPTHTEIKIFNKRPYIIEIACRLGGDYITSDLVPLSTGIDMLGNLIKLSVGETIDVKKIINKYSCVQFINELNYNKCKEFIYTEENIIKYEIKPFSNKDIKNSLDRLGYIIFQRDTLQELENTLKKITL